MYPPPFYTHTLARSLFGHESALAITGIPHAASCNAHPACACTPTVASPKPHLAPPIPTSTLSPPHHTPCPSPRTLQPITACALPRPSQCRHCRIHHTTHAPCACASQVQPLVLSQAYKPSFFGLLDRPIWLYKCIVRPHANKFYSVRAV